jgi:DNA-binding beta-propeller fold protein YncE
LWTANAQDGTVSVVDIPGKRVVATLDAKVYGANRLKFTLDGKRVLISMLGDSDLVIYNASTRVQEKRVKMGHGAAGILMQPDGARAFVSCGPDNYVAVIDLKTLEMVGKVMVAGPDGLAWAVQQ